MGAQGGFTLAELMIVLAVMAILLAVAAPDLQSFTVKHKGEAALSALTSAVQSARTTAIRTMKTVTVCRSRDGATCAGSWSQGFIVFSDRNGDRRINQDDELLHVRQFTALSGTISWRAFGNRQYLQIDALGTIMHQNGNFTFCPDNRDTTLARQLIVSQTGRIRTARDSNGDGIIEDSSGSPAACP